MTEKKKKTGKWKVGSLKAKEAAMGYLFTLPWLIGVIVFVARPLIQSFNFALSKVKMTPKGRISMFIGLSNFQTCRAACPPYVVPSFRHKQCMNPASLQFRLSLSRAILSMRATVHYRARRGEWRKTILSRKLICAVILFKHKQLRLRVRTLII